VALHFNLANNGQTIRFLLYWTDPQHCYRYFSDQGNINSNQGNAWSGVFSTAHFTDGSGDKCMNAGCGVSTSSSVSQWKSKGDNKARLLNFPASQWNDLVDIQPSLGPKLSTSSQWYVLNWEQNPARQCCSAGGHYRYDHVPILISGVNASGVETRYNGGSYWLPIPHKATTTSTSTTTSTTSTTTTRPRGF